MRWVLNFFVTHLPGVQGGKKTGGGGKKERGEGRKSSPVLLFVDDDEGREGENRKRKSALVGSCPFRLRTGSYQTQERKGNDSRGVREGPEEASFFMMEPLLRPAPRREEEESVGKKGGKERGETGVLWCLFPQSYRLVGFATVEKSEGKRGRRGAIKGGGGKIF